MDNIKEIKIKKGEQYLLTTYTNVTECTLYDDARDIVGGFSIGITEIKPLCDVSYFNDTNSDMLNIVYNLVKYLVNYFKEDEDLSWLYNGRFNMKYLKDFTQEDALSYIVRELEFDDEDDVKEDILPALLKFQQNLIEYWKKLLEKFGYSSIFVDYLMPDEEDEENDETEEEAIIIDEDNLDRINEENDETEAINEYLSIDLIKVILSDYCKFYWDQDISSINQLKENVVILEDCNLLKIAE